MRSDTREVTGWHSPDPQILQGVGRKTPARPISFSPNRPTTNRLGANYRFQHDFKSLEAPECS